jgi:hypothetical protein
MTRTFVAYGLLLATGLFVACEAQKEEAPVPTMSINDLMVTVVTPATDTLWGIEDPQTNEEWQVYIDAANEIITASETIKIGGTGPEDNERAADPAWQAFADQLISAAQDARRAAENKDLDAMFAAGEVLYPPCEECHIQFHPGVESAE